MIIEPEKLAGGVMVIGTMCLPAANAATVTSPAIAYLRRDEWTMGNGQCGECYGVSDRFAAGCSSHRERFGSAFIYDRETPGHIRGCALAIALESLGQVVMWRPDP